MAVLSFAGNPLWAAANGSISGTITDPSGAVIPGASLTLVNTTLHAPFKTVCDDAGAYTFPALPVAHYDLMVEASGFQTQTRTDIAVDTDAAIKVDVTLDVGGESQTVAVQSNLETEVDTVDTHLGDVVSGRQMTSIPLNGRSYTDLLAIQPGIAPVSTLLPNSVIMAGVTGAIAPSGALNSGNLSINGQRESSNGFMINGIDVQERMNGGTSVIPNLDSIDEFRVLTDNFDPEYGNYNGGVITVVTKSGSDNFHGSAFEFLRNTALDARGFFDPTRPAFRQNQFGGTIGGPIKHQKVFFFSDYQGTRTMEGVETGLITVPSLAQRSGNFGNQLTRCVSGPYIAGTLSQDLGTSVLPNDPYSPGATGCTPGRPAVFPNGVIPQSAWSAPGRALLQYIPAPNTNGSDFTTAAYNETVRDDKGSFRVDANSRVGQLSGYYFVDDYLLDNPYPGQQGGASIPGFDALNAGRAQQFALEDTTVFGANMVNELHVGFLRNVNNIGQPHGGKGVSMASQGFVSGPGTPGIVIQAPQFEGVENITFPSFVMGVPITNVDQINNTIYVSDTLSKVIGAHNLKFGGQLHFDQVNEHPNATFNGTFNINGTETGNAFADFLIGVPSNFTQSSGEPFYLRNRYLGFFAQDSWRARRDLTINAGVRWDYIMPWWEKYNQLQTIVVGETSQVYPGGPTDLVFPGDKGIPRSISPSKGDNFAPRIGLAYAPRFENQFLQKIFGKDGNSSIRASYGIFYTAFPGLSAGIMYAVPPFGYNYLSPAPPLFATPFINAANGANNGQRFPFTFPPHGASVKNPYTGVNWPNFVPISADPYFYYRNSVPYINNYMVSIQRQITGAMLFTASYVGNQGHHILALLPTNVGNPALCLSLSQPSQVAPGSATCGPFGEDSQYTSTSGQVYQGTRAGLGPNYGVTTAQSSIANSNYNAFEAILRYNAHGAQLLLGYTYSKSIDQGSNLGEQLNPINLRATRAISAWDMRHNVVATYTVPVPFDTVFRRSGRLTSGWTVSGVSRFATGFPVTLLDNSDNSLLGTLGNGVNNLLLDTPVYTPGPLQINTNGRNGRNAFNTSLFSEESLGTLGNAKRRFFYGPGIINTDLTLNKVLPLTEAKALELRFEAFNVFNHPQFYGPAAVDGRIEDPDFGHIVQAASPRLVQVAVKFKF